MDTDELKTSGQLADEARQSAREAADAARNFAQSSVDAGREALASVRQGLAQGAHEAVSGSRAYARDAVNASGKRIGEGRDRFEHVRRRGEQYLSDQPLRAALIAAAGGALLTALFIAFLNGGRR